MNGTQPLFLQKTVGLTEMPVAKPQPPVGAQGRGMARNEDVVPVLIYESGLLPGITAPKQEYQPFPGCAKLCDHRVGKALPPFVLVAACLMGPHRKGGIEQQNPLPGPSLQVAATGVRRPGVCFNFLENINQ